jgi:Phage integrase family
MTFRRELALHHAAAYALVHRPGEPAFRMHVLYLLHSDRHPEPFVPLIQYVLDSGRTRSLSWQRDTVLAVGLLVDFMAAKGHGWMEVNRVDAFRSFAEALVAGSVDDSGCDPSCLFWEPRSVPRAKHLLARATTFADWMANRTGGTPLNPLRTASWGERIASLRNADRRASYALLAQAAYREGGRHRSQTAREVHIARRSINADRAEVPAFDKARIDQLLLDGFARRGNALAPLQDRLSIKDMLITVLLHGGGLRLSEPFHLFVSDVAVDPHRPSSASVRVFHPEQGAAPPDYRDPLTDRPIVTDREDYLRRKWNWQPRNLTEGRFHAGWKDLYLTDGKKKFAQVHWFPAFWGEAFLTLFHLYVTHHRSRHCPHPFLFVSDKASVRGEPYTMASYAQAHARAVRRIGLAPARELGTTPHGHRHAYGQALAEAGVDRTILQRALHHRSPWSQDVYTNPTSARIVEALQKASLMQPTGPDNSPATRLGMLCPSAMGALL